MATSSMVLRPYNPAAEPHPHTSRTVPASAQPKPLMPSSSSLAGASDLRSLASQPQRRASMSRRRNSLRIPIQPPEVPIPPTLLHSPYLNSPKLLQPHDGVSPHLPTEEDELWLQDTVPLGSTSSVANGHKSPAPSTPDATLRPMPLTPPATRSRVMVGGARGGDPPDAGELGARFGSMDLDGPTGRLGLAPSRPNCSLGPVSSCGPEGFHGQQRRASMGSLYAVPFYARPSSPTHSHHGHYIRPHSPLASPALVARYDQGNSLYLSGVPTPPSHYFSEANMR